MHLNPGYTSLPFIAEWRLPFLPKIELWKLISKVLSLHLFYQRFARDFQNLISNRIYRMKTFRYK